MSVKRGKFITVEGGEGVGKSTNIEVIKSHLEQKGIDYIQTREPGGTVLAERIRDLLLEKHGEAMDPTTELLLVFAARSQHLNSLIRPTLESGTWVLCDRFTDATYAYQGAGRQLGFSLISELENLVQGDLRPDLTIILDLDPEIGLQRARSRGELDRFEVEELEFFKAVRACYQQIAESSPQRCAVIDASEDLEKVKALLIQTLDSRL